MHRFASLAFAAALLPLTPAPADASRTTAANRFEGASVPQLGRPLSRSPGPDGAGTSAAQSFVARVSGTVRRISVAAASGDTDPTGLELAITTLVDDEPGATLAAAPALTPNLDGVFASPGELDTTAAFSEAGVQLEAGVAYALVFNLTRAGTFTLLGDSRPYADGQAYSRVGDADWQPSLAGDFLFEVTVVPEPSAVGAVFACRIGRPRRRRR